MKRNVWEELLTSSFCPPYLPLAQQFRVDGQFQAVVFSSGRSVGEQPALPTGLWHVHDCRTQSCLKWGLPFESLFTDLEFSRRITLVPGFGAMEMKSCFLPSGGSY